MTQHFVLPEFLVSGKAQLLGIDNTPPQEVEIHLEFLMQELEQVRTLLGYPMHISSGYRCPQLNRAIGGSKDSAHMQGFAADFTCPQFGAPPEIVRRLAASGLRFDQLIQESTWVHISFDPRMRQEVLTAHFVPGGPTVYTKGV